MEVLSAMLTKGGPRFWLKVEESHVPIFRVGLMLLIKTSYYPICFR